MGHGQFYPSAGRRRCLFSAVSTVISRGGRSRRRLLIGVLPRCRVCVTRREGAASSQRQDESGQRYTPPVPHDTHRIGGSAVPKRTSGVTGGRQVRSGRRIAHRPRLRSGGAQAHRDPARPPAAPRPGPVARDPRRRLPGSQRLMASATGPRRMRWSPRPRRGRRHRRATGPRPARRAPPGPGRRRCSGRCMRRRRAPRRRPR